MKELIKQACGLIQDADGLLIAAGAGMGVDSGLPDFRGNEGFWKAYPFAKEESLSFQDLANPSWFKQDPSRAWGFYGHRLNLYRATKPHEGFSILKRWGDSKLVRPFVFTSNVDGQFQKSGFEDGQIYECHGSIHYLQCSVDCHTDIWPVANTDIAVDMETCRAEGRLPRCPKCQQVARPNIFMFGDLDWIESRAEEQQQRFGAWRETMRGLSLVIIEIGAGVAIPSVRNQSKRLNGTVIRINPRLCESGSKVISLPMNGLDAIRAIDKYLY